MKGLNFVCITCWVSFLVTSLVAADGQLTVPPSTEGTLGENAALKCRLETNDRWYVIKWSRVYDNGSDILLVSLPSGQMVPDWNPDIARSLRMRIQPLITVQAGMVEFYLVLGPLLCEDMGRYRCRAVAAFGDPTDDTQLTLLKQPGSPRVMYEQEVWIVNATFSIYCQASAGIPPQEFLWYYKTPRMRNFQIAEGQSEAEFYPEEDCSMKIIRTLHITVTSESGGMVYRCALPGRVDDFYDEIAVQLPPPASTFQNGKSCTEKGCALQAEESNTNRASGRTRSNLLTTTMIGCCVLSVFMLGSLQHLSEFSHVL